MKRSLLICAAALTMLVNVPDASADKIQLTLDLLNADRANAASGGSWQLYARRITDANGPSGANGIAGIRAVLSNVTESGISFASGINQLSDKTYTNTLSNGAVEIVYGQDISSSGVLTTVGVPQSGQAATRDTLIASGVWPAGDRPAFGVDANGYSSEGNFLLNSSAPWGDALEVSGGNILTSVVTLGDLNGNSIINNLDAIALLPQLPGAANPAPYNPAGDIANPQNGIVNNLDAIQFLNILSGSLVGGGATLAAVSVVPEPSTIGLAVLASMGLIARRRRA